MKHTIIDGLRLDYRDTGKGLPFVFQHGLGGDALQTADVSPSSDDDAPPLRVVTLECRGQGGSPLGDSPPSIARFANDVRALINELALDRPVIGGISMGAAIALRLAATASDAYRGLVLARPAWETTNAPANMRPFAQVASLLQDFGADEGRSRYMASHEAIHLKAESPDNYQSLLNQFDTPDPEVRARLLAAIANDGPGINNDTLATLDIPTLVIGNTDDTVHPLAMARRIASVLPNADFTEIPAKTQSREAYRAGFRHALARFLQSIADQDHELANA